VYGCLFSVIVCLTVAWIRFSETADAGVFFYTRFSVLHHAGYFAMFLNFAIALLLIRIWISSSITPRWEKRVIPVIVFLFTMVVVLLSSKMGMLTLGILYLCFSIVMLIKRAPIRITVVPLASLVFMLILIFASPATLERWITTTRTVESMEQLRTDTDESTGERIHVWRSSWNVIKDHPWVGVGTGDVKDALLNEYAKQGITYAVSRNLDAHNQYLQTTISLGISGILALLAMIVLPGLAAWKREDYLYLSFLFLFGMNMLVESMFENQAGVVFYAFFNALLFWQLLIANPDSMLIKKRLPHGETVSE
jgi:O-antigen ligase